MPQKEKQKGNKNRKYGRNLVKCKIYRTEGRRERNKKRRTLAREKRYARNRTRKVA